MTDCDEVNKPLGDTHVDKDVERLMHHIAEIVEILRGVENDLETNRHGWTEKD